MHDYRVLIVTFEFPPDRGGVGRYMHSMFSHLEKNITVIADGGSEVVRENGVRVIRIQLLSKIFWPRWLRTVFLVMRMAKRYKSNLIVTPYILPLGTALFIVSKLKHIPYIISLHGFDILAATVSFRKRFLAKLILKNAKGVMVNSSFTEKTVGALFPTLKQVKMIHPCAEIVSEKKDKIVLRKKYSVGMDEKLVLSVGRLVRRKGFDTVIRSLSLVRKHVQTIRYIVIGNGPDAAYLTKLARDTGVSGLISFVTDADDNMLHDYYALSDVFAMPARQIGSDVEGFGIVFLEAQLHGLPVIGSYSGGIPDAVADGVSGLLVPPDNREALSRAIITILTDERLKKMFSKNGTQRVSEYFSCTIQRKLVNNWLSSL